MADKPRIHVFVDNSNVLLEGRRCSQMRKKGAARLSAFLDDSYEVDWGKFLYVVQENDQRGLANVPILYGSRPPPNDSVWQRIRDDGFDTKVFGRNIRNKEKGVDMEMGMDIVELRDRNYRYRCGRCGLHTGREARPIKGLECRGVVLGQRSRRSQDGRQSLRCVG